VVVLNIDKYRRDTMNIMFLPIRISLISTIMGAIYSILVTIGLLGIVLPAVDAIQSAMSDYWIFVAGYIALLIIFQLRGNPKNIYTAKMLWINNRILLPGSILLLVCIYGLEVYRHTETYITTPKFLLSNDIRHILLIYGLNTKATISLTMLTYAFSILGLPKKLLRQSWDRIVFFSFLLITFFISTHFPSVFADISLNLSGSDDDKLMEWLQVLVLAIGVLFSFRLGFRRRYPVLLRIMYIVSTVFMVLLIGEELSWGERLLPIDLPTTERNMQQEFNLHNHGRLESIVAFGYIALFIYALLSWLTRKYAHAKHWISQKNKHWWDFFCFRGNEVLFFIPTFLINPYYGSTLVGGIPSQEEIYAGLEILPGMFKMHAFANAWKESFEVLFYTGITIHFFTILRSVDGERKTKSIKSRDNSL